MSIETYHIWLDDFLLRLASGTGKKNRPYNEIDLICSSVISSIYHESLIPRAAIAAPLGWH